MALSDQEKAEIKDKMRFRKVIKGQSEEAKPIHQEKKSWHVVDAFLDWVKNVFK